MTDSVNVGLSSYAKYSFTSDFFNNVTWECVTPPEKRRKPKKEVVLRDGEEPCFNSPAPPHQPNETRVSSENTIISTAASNIVTEPSPHSGGYTFFIPTQQSDTLLWCAYIIIRGFSSYDKIRNYYTEGNQFKYDMIEQSRAYDIKKIAKDLRISLKRIDQNLTCDPYISLETFRGLLLLHGKPDVSTIIVDGRKTYEVTHDSSEEPSQDTSDDITDKTYYIVEKVRGNYGIYIFDNTILGQQEENKRLVLYKTKYWKMESLDNAIRPLSAFKLPELIELSSRLDISPIKRILGDFGTVTEKRKTRQEIYDDIIRAIG
jgi:uncharacterized protein involved in tolerance to divalent cations